MITLEQLDFYADNESRNLECRSLLTRNEALSLIEAARLAVRYREEIELAIGALLDGNCHDLPGGNTWALASDLRAALAPEKEQK